MTRQLLRDLPSFSHLLDVLGSTRPLYLPTQSICNALSHLLRAKSWIDLCQCRSIYFLNLASKIWLCILEATIERVNYSMSSLYMLKISSQIVAPFVLVPPKSKIVCRSRTIPFVNWYHLLWTGWREVNKDKTLWVWTFYVNSMPPHLLARLLIAELFEKIQSIWYFS